jgi:hypothetical protein
MNVAVVDLFLDFLKKHNFFALFTLQPMTNIPESGNGCDQGLLFQGLSQRGKVRLNTLMNPGMRHLPALSDGTG